VFYKDEDKDGYGVTYDSRCLLAPSAPFTATRTGDCDDSDPDVNPGATERCNGKDDDCDQLTDEVGAQGCRDYLLDADGDGYGVAGDAKCLCAPSGSYTATKGGDCNDSDRAINPGATETCNGRDDNCDGQIDEERTSGQCGIDGYTLYYYDGDGDRYGLTGNTKCLCSPSGKYTATSGGDCNDSDARAHPGASAVCGIDADCDGSLLDPGEVCDDGNSFGWDGCTDCLYLEFQVNTWTTGEQWFPSITSLSNGGFVVVWESDGQDGSGDGVYGQRFDSNGNKVGWEFQVNTWTIDWQEYPSITSLSNAGFVVVWQSGCDPDRRIPCAASPQDGSKFGVYGQRFDSNGNKLGSEFRVNTWTTGNQSAPSITSLPNGGFVVVWESDGQDGSRDGVYGQRFDSNGNKVGSEFQVNTWTTYDQENPSITSLSNGGFVVVWEGFGQDGSNWGVYGQRFDSNGNKVGSEFQVNTWTTDYQGYPSIASLPNGGFVVVWERHGQDGEWDGVYGQRFDSNGNKVGSEFRVNTSWALDYYQLNPSVTWLSNGGFVVVWAGAGQGDTDGVYGQRFDSDGNEVGSEFQVNTWTIDWQEYPSITSLSNGGFVVVWESQGHDGDGYGVYGRIFSQ
jgi:hypothetical protein